MKKLASSAPPISNTAAAIQPRCMVVQSCGLCDVARESNFWVYAAVSALVAALAAWLDVSTERWCLLVLCMSTVVVAEMFLGSQGGIGKVINDRTYGDDRAAQFAAVVAAARSTSSRGVWACRAPAR